MARSRSVRVVPLRGSEPRLRLETLTAGQVELVLVATYTAVVAATAIALLERQTYVDDELSIRALPELGVGAAASAAEPCWAGRCDAVSLGPNASWWADGREFVNATATELLLSVRETNFVKLHANLSTLSARATENGSFSLRVQTIANITGWRSDQGGAEPGWVSVANVSRAGTLTCDAGEVGCEPLPLVELDVVEYSNCAAAPSPTRC